MLICLRVSVRAFFVSFLTRRRAVVFRIYDLKDDGFIDFDELFAVRAVCMCVSLCVSLCV